MWCPFFLPKTDDLIEARPMAGNGYNRSPGIFVSPGNHGLVSYRCDLEALYYALLYIIVLEVLLVIPTESDDRLDRCGVPCAV